MLKLFCDRRVKPDRYYVAEEEELMFVPEVVQHCVAFIFCDFNGKKTAAGTAFLIAMKGPTENWGWSYAVTARHVIEDIKDQADNDKVYFRLNRRSGKAEFIETDINDWVSHPSDPMVDVAVLSWGGIKRGHSQFAGR